MNRNCLNVQLIVVILVVAAVNLFAEDAPNTIPTIDGTYQLVSRVQLADSTTVMPPDVVGMATYQKEYRQTVIAWRDANGLVFASSVIAKYFLTDTSYTETIIYSATHDEIHSQPVKYNFEERSLSVPLKKVGAKISFMLPFGPASLVFEKDKLTSTVEGVSVDSWERIK